jgi:phage terminase small subunit
MRGNPSGRPYNPREPTPAPGLGAPPPTLSEGARLVWLELAPGLEACGVGTQVDRPAFELLVDALADYRRLRDRSEQAAYATSAAKRLTRLLGEFGMTPASRARVEVTPPVSALAAKYLSHTAKYISR